RARCVVPVFAATALATVAARLRAVATADRRPACACEHDRDPDPSTPQHRTHHAQLSGGRGERRKGAPIARDALCLRAPARGAAQRMAGIIGWNAPPGAPPPISLYSWLFMSNFQSLMMNQGM